MVLIFPSWDSVTQSHISSYSRETRQSPCVPPTVGDWQWQVLMRPSDAGERQRATEILSVDQWVKISRQLKKNSRSKRKLWKNCDQNDLHDFILFLQTFFLQKFFHKLFYIFIWQINRWFMSEKTVFNLHLILEWNIKCQMILICKSNTYKTIISQNCQTNSSEWFLIWQRNLEK